MGFFITASLPVGISPPQLRRGNREAEGRWCSYRFSNVFVSTLLLLLLPFPAFDETVREESREPDDDGRLEGRKKAGHFKSFHDRAGEPDEDGIQDDEEQPERDDGDRERQDDEHRPDQGVQDAENQGREQSYPERVDRHARDEIGERENNERVDEPADEHDERLRDMTFDFLADLVIYVFRQIEGVYVDTRPFFDQP